MSIKILGIFLVITGCGGFGFLIAASHRQEEMYLKQLLSALEFMECELQYHMTPLPGLCALASEKCSGALRKIFICFSKELKNQISPDAKACMDKVLSEYKDRLPVRLYKEIALLGECLGHFDLDGQLKGLTSIFQTCSDDLKQLTENQAVRLRSYQTLALCAGAAIVILLI